MKKCPFCAEEIQDEAIKCKYCGEWLSERSQRVPSLAPLRQEDRRDTERILLKQKSNMDIGIILEYLSFIMNYFIVIDVLPGDQFNKYMAGLFLIGLFLIGTYTNRLTESLGFGLLKRILFCLLNILPIINAFVTVNLGVRIKKKIEKMKKRAEAERTNAPSV